MIGQLRSVVLDCPEPLSLARFYAALLGLEIVSVEDDWVVAASTDRRTELAFQLAPDLQPPQWPDPAHPQQFHLDIAVADPELAHQQVLALGATALGGPEDGFRVYADPAGHPFCLVWSLDPLVAPDDPDA